MHDQISGSRTMMGSVYLFIFWIKLFTIIKSTCIKSQSHLISYATNSMIQYPKVARDNLVLQNGPGRNVYSVAMVSNDDHSSTEAHCSKYQTLSKKKEGLGVLILDTHLPSRRWHPRTRWGGPARACRGWSRTWPGRRTPSWSACPRAWPAAWRGTFSVASSSVRAILRDTRGLNEDSVNFNAKEGHVHGSIQI